MTVAIRDQQRKIKVNLPKLRRDAEHLLDLLRLNNVEVSILLTNDHRMKVINKTYRNKNVTTDVLSFPMNESSHDVVPGEETLLGDIVINVHMSKRRASVSREAFSSVVRQLLIHGLLHLIGYDHEVDHSEARKMQKKEKQLIDALTEMDRKR
jgi:probable rRNA maturation factor